jgi:LmbE family N-acetylglucosaminyl deacetylase
VGLTLVISPHLDDAVLSVGGSMAAWSAAGERVVVATVCTDGPPLDALAPSMRTLADYPVRRREDADACAAVGAEFRWLGHVERAFRRPFLTARACFTTRTLFDRAEVAERAAIQESLAALDALAPDRILVPLGVGNHVDHVVALIAATEWALTRGWRDRLLFYEDFYALSTAMRRAHPVACLRSWPCWRSPLVRAPRLAMILGAIALSRRGPAVTTLLSSEIASARWSPEPPTIIDEPRKLAAVALYPSQTMAFGGMTGIAASLRAYHAWWRGEPLWRAYGRV